MALPMEGNNVSRLQSQAMMVSDDVLDQVHAELREYAAPICKTASETPLPPLRAINHTIPLIDEQKIYPWRSSQCPEAFHSQWDQKRQDYLASGRWKLTTTGNSIPMLLILKVGKLKHLLWTVVDLHACNANTHKVSAPLPNIKGILHCVAKCKYRSMIDRKDACEQICIVPEHVDRTIVTTPDGNMVSLVLQQSDCNAPTMYQALMNHIFPLYLGVFMEVYLDDIIIYSDSLEDHVKHVKCILGMLKQEQLYLSSSKLNFLPKEMKVLGQIIDDNGIHMDPNKVDSMTHWKTPTSKGLLSGF